MDITPRLASPSTMVTTNPQLRLDGPSTMGNCQVSWLVNNGYIPLNHVKFDHIFNKCGRFRVGFASPTKGFLSLVCVEPPKGFPLLEAMQPCHTPMTYS